MVSGQCIRMRTDYTSIKRDTLYGGQQPSLSLADAQVSCQGVGGILAEVTDELIHDVIVLLRTWRHAMEMGHVWIANDDDNGVCRLIKVKPASKIKGLEMIIEIVTISAIILKCVSFRTSHICHYLN